MRSGEEKTTMVDETKQQDVDMLYVLKKIKQNIRSFFGGIAWLISFSIRHFLKILIFILFTVGIAIGLYYMKRGYYASSVTVGHLRVDNDYCKELVNNLGSYVDGKNNALLAQALHIPQEQAREVRKLEYAPLNENLARRYSDSSHVLLPFKVNAEVFDRSVLDSLESGILQFLENTDYAQKRKDIDTRLITDAQSRVVAEIGAIDSLKDIVNQSIIPRGMGTGLVYGEPLNPVDVYKRSMELFEQRQKLNQRMSLNNSFEVIINFNKSAKRADTSIVVYILLGVIIGYLVGLFWLIPRQNGTAA
jgi:hypothetical protein